VAHVSFSRMADPVDIRPDVHRLIDALPASASWDDVAYEIYVRQAVDQGVADAEAGRLHSHDDAMARVRARIRRAS
jgi:predicted transcriptional regulator